MASKKQSSHVFSNANDDTKNLTPERPYYTDPNETWESFKPSLILSEFDNYPKWYRAMVRDFTFRKKLDFADGKIAVPAKDHPMYEAWKINNELVLSWILKAVSPEIAKSVQEMDNAVDVWRNLKKRFSPGDQFMISDILEEIYSLRLGERDVESYFNEFNALWNELELLRPLPRCTCVTSRCSCDAMQRVKEQIDQEKVWRFLKGLDAQRFDLTRIHFKYEDPLPSIGEVYKYVSRREEKFQILIHSIHPHPLTLKGAGAAYECSGCLELGLGCSYRCETDNCNYILHQDCADIAKFPGYHFLKGSRFEFCKKKHDGHERCNACGNDMLGFFYRCLTTGKYLHPCCFKLKDSVSDKEKHVTLDLCETAPKKCKICEGKEVENNIKGWSYVSSVEKYCFHVSCVKGLIRDKWNDGYLPRQLSHVPAAGRCSDVQINTAALAFELIVSVIFGHPHRYIGGLIEHISPIRRTAPTPTRKFR